MSAIPANDGAPRSARRAAGIGIGGHPELADAMLDAIPSDAPVVFDLGDIYAYSADTGTWSPVPVPQLSCILQGFTGATVTDPFSNKARSLRLRKSDFDGALTFAQHKAAKPGFFDAAPAGFVFSNGFLRITDKGVALEPHSPEHRARLAYPFAFDASARATRYLAALQDIFRDDPEAEQKIAVLQEFAGASLFGIAPDYQKCLVPHGEGANGKSFVIKVISGAFPKEAVCAIEPQAWGQDYKRALLAGKLLNAVNEMPEADILSGEDFKNVITGEPKTARNPSEKAFTFRPRAGHIFAANKLPGTNDHSHGFWRRIIPIKFGRVFQKHEQIPGLAETIIATEMSGTVMWMVEGAVRLKQTGRYTEIQSAERALQEWRREADTVATFIDERTVEATCDSEYTLCSVLHSSYKDWSVSFGFKSMNVTNYGRRLKSLGLKSRHIEGGEAYPIRLLRPGEVNPRHAQRALADMVEREREAEEAWRTPGAVTPITDRIAAVGAPF